MLPSLLKSMLRARSSMAPSSTSTPRWALKRRQVWRNSSMEIRPSAQHRESVPHLSGDHSYVLFTWMIFVDNVEDDLDVGSVSEQSFRQIWGDLKRERNFITRVCFCAGIQWKTSLERIFIRAHCFLLLQTFCFSHLYLNVRLWQLLFVTFFYFLEIFDLIYNFFSFHSFSVCKKTCFSSWVCFCLVLLLASI